MFDEFLVPDFDPTERKSIAEYLALLKVAFDPHDTIIRNHKNANRIANNMVNVDGYSVEQMYSVVDEAREFHGLEKIERAQQSVQRTGLPTRTELANAYADALLAKKRAKIASR